MNAWIVVLGAGGGSFLLRTSLVFLFVDHPVPRWVETLAGYVVPAAFAALAATALLDPIGAGGRAAAPPAIAVGVTAVVAAAERRSPLYAFAAGLVTLWLTSAALAVA